ncbi:MAG: glycosyltransferase family 39 protein [Chloroflexi bacterium]|nr:glycosyltransferase family 39 protein [Chloroflexota bacterium]
MQKRHPPGTRPARIILTVSLILLVAAFLRLWALPQLPLGMHYDQAANVTLMRQIASGESLPLFIPSYTGKEVLFFYWAALWSAILGGAPWALWLASACIGILTVAATFTAARALLAQEPHAVWIALFAAAWLAISFSHVLLSRDGFRAITLPLLEMLTIAALWHGLRSRHTGWGIVAGCLLGLTGYTYLAARLFPIPLAITLCWFLLRAAHAERRQQLPRLAVMLAAAAMTFAPLGIYFITHPETFSTRIAQVAAPTLQEALNGVWLCLKGLVLPGAGDPYIRFNQPGRPILDPLFAVLAGVGLIALLRPRPTSAADGAARLLLVLAPLVMLLPSALATAEITPSNLRLVGVYPFLAIWVGIGAVKVLQPLARLPYLRAFGLGLLLLPGAILTHQAYTSWATSSELFYATDGEMVLAAKALDAADLSHTTAYIASLHYRHPTVAALANHYSQAKWLTGGSTLVLPPQGDALYIVPASLPPPAGWPTALTQRWTTEAAYAPDGSVALTMHRLSAKDIAALRPTQVAADFAHVTIVHNAEALAPCYVSEPCPILVTWQPRAPYPGEHGKEHSRPLHA